MRKFISAPLAHKKIIIGLTGSFGTGKSTVAGIFKSFGAAVIDADKIAHNLIKPDTQGYKRITFLFGKGILKKDLTVDRRRLGRIVFGHPALLNKLNRIIHPQVIRVIKKRIRACGKGIIIVDAPLLIEANLRNLADKLIVVKADRKKQIERISRKMGLAKNEILKRIRMQIPLSDKVRIADFVIDNNGTLKETKKQVEVILADVLDTKAALIKSKILRVKD